MIMGADDYMKAYAKANADAFVQKEPAPKQNDPQFVAPASGNTKTGPKMSLSELMKAKNENPEFVVNFD